MEKPLMNSFFIFFLYRMSSVFIVQTYYVPDEYWQSLEVAHNMVFGYGYLTWEWKEGLRSYLYPSCFAFAYKCLKYFHMDFVYLVTLVPKLLQALLTAVSDQYFILLCKNFGFDDFWAKIYLLTNWFWYYCGSRTIINTFETSLTVIALYYYPWYLFINKKKGKNESDYKTLTNSTSKSLKYMTLSAVNCVIRPTAVTIWGPLIVLHLLNLPSKNVKHIIQTNVLPVFIGVLTVSMLIDFLWYGRIIIPAYNFLIFNVVKNISPFYGAHPFYWYITEGLPAVLGLHMLPFSLGLKSFIIKSFTETDGLLHRVFAIWIFIVGINIVILSSIPHKEFRFVLPLFPLITLIAVKATTDYFATSRKYSYFWIFLLTVGFIVLIGLLGIFHQRGPLQLIEYLSHAISECNRKCSFLFLMPCHSTPLYSHLHANVSTKFLTCEPPITDDIRDESEDFFRNPVQWLQEYWDDKNPPSHVAMFDTLESFVSPFLKRKNFIKKCAFFHSFFAEKNTGQYIVLYQHS